MDPNKIAIKLLCPICKTLPLEPVIAEDGHIYERKEIECKIRDGNGSDIFPKSFFSAINVKLVIEDLVYSGQLQEEYLGGWNVDAALIKKNAEDGDPTSMVELGELYLKGNQVEMNKEEGYKWFKRAYEMEDALGTARMADCLIAGVGVASNKDEGHTMLNESALIDRSVYAAIRLWYYYSTGWDGFDDEDKSRTIKWMGKVKKISPNLSENGIDRMKTDLIDLIGVPKNSDCNIALLAKKAEDGDPKSMVELGELYLKGNQVEMNKTEGYKWFKRASEMEDALGTARMADCLIAGVGVASNEDEGSAILVQSAHEDRSVHAAMRLCHYYRTGLHGFPQEQSKSNKWMDRVKKMSSNLSENEIEHMMADISDLIGNDDQSGINASKQTPPSSQNLPDTNNELCPNPTEINFQSSHFNPSDQCDTCDITEPLIIPGTKAPEHNNSSMSTIYENGTNVKACLECSHSKPQAGFTASQWKKRVGTGRCVACVSKTVQWNSSNIVADLTKKVCHDCKIGKSHAEFSPNQWRRVLGTGRCRVCVGR